MRDSRVGAANSCDDGARRVTRHPPKLQNSADAAKCTRGFLIFGSSRNLGGRAAWGRSCGSAKLLAGTLRCLHLCWRFPWNWSPAQQLGRCPKPHKGRRPLTPQGTDEKGRSPPLTLFSAPGLGALPLLFLFLRLFLLIQGFFPIKHLPHLPLRFLHHPIALLNRMLLRVVINLRPE